MTAFLLGPAIRSYAQKPQAGTSHLGNGITDATAGAPGSALETRSWIRIDPQSEEVDRAVLRPRSAQSQARIEALIARHPSLADAGSSESAE